MSNLLKRLDNKRKDIEQLKKFLTWDYDEATKDQLRQQLKAEETELARYYK